MVMMSLAYIVYVTAAALVLFLLPGMILTRLFAPGRFQDSFFAVSAALGVCVVSYVSLLVTGLLGLVLQAHVTLASVAGYSLLISLGGASAIAVRERGFGFVRELFLVRPLTAWSPGLLAFLALTVVLYLMSYENAVFDQESCVVRAGMLPVFTYLSDPLPLYFTGCDDVCFGDRNAFLVWTGGQRLGPMAFFSTFFAAFGLPGPAVLHSVFGLLAAWFGFHLGRRFFGKRIFAYLCAAVLALNPFALSIPLLNENVMTLALGAALLFVAFERPTQWAFVGVFLGLFIGVRHVGILSLPAVFYLAWRYRREFQQGDSVHRGNGAPVVLAISLLLSSIPWIFHHTELALRAPAVFESFLSYHPVEHSFLGWEFGFKGLLNWPFTDDLLRSPYTAYPPLIAYPLVIIRTYGALLLALVVPGLLWIWRRNRDLFVAGMLWLCVQVGLLSVMSNWVQPDKMGVFLCFSQPLVLAMVAGAVSLYEALWSSATPLAVGRVAAVSLAVLGLTVSLGIPALVEDYRAPVDQRNFEYRERWILEEYPVVPPMLKGLEHRYADRDRDLLTSVSLLPDLTMVRKLWSPSLLFLRVDQIVDVTSRPFVKDFRDKPIDIWRTLPGIPSPPVQSSQGEAVLGTSFRFIDSMYQPISRLRNALGGKRSVTSVENTPGPWMTLELDLSRAPITNETFLREAVPAVTGDPPAPRVLRPLLSAGHRPSWADGEQTHFAVLPVEQDYYWLVIWFGEYRFSQHDGREDADWLRSAPSGRHLFQLPLGSVVRVVEFTSVGPTRLHEWTATVDGPLELHGPVPVSH